MKPDISEFSYGYALVEQIAQNNAFQITAAPVFPSLIQEGQQGGGYDAALQFGGVPLFLQFKLSDHLERANAKEANNMGLPYYRMHLRSARHSYQHEMLLDLENRGELVFYVAPMFHLPEELNDAYLNRQVIQRSMFIKPSTIGVLPDAEEHYVVFNDAQDLLVCSEPKKVEKGSFGFGVFVKDSIHQIETGKRRTNRRDDMEELSNQMIQIVEHSKEKGFWKGVDPRTLRSDREPLIQTAYLARTFLGCEMFVLRYDNR
jgi:hypothetical protein